MPFSLVSPLGSASVATLPWLALMHAGTVPVRLEGPVAEVSGHSSVQKLDAGARALGTTTTTAALDWDVKTLTLPVDPDVGMGTRLMAVVCCGRKGDS